MDWQGGLVAGEQTDMGSLRPALCMPVMDTHGAIVLCANRLPVPCACLLCFGLLHETGVGVCLFAGSLLAAGLRRIGLPVLGRLWLVPARPHR